MILLLWIILLGLAFLFLFTGYIFYQTQVSDILIIVGWTFVFALGVILLSNAVEYKIGSSEIVSYTYYEYNYSIGLENYTSIVINNSITTINDTYQAFSSEGTGVLQRVANSHLWGFLLMVAGLFGAILFWFDVRAYSKESEDERINNES